MLHSFAGPSLLALLLREWRGAGSQRCKRDHITAGSDIIEESDSLPFLQPETRITSYGAVCRKRRLPFDCIIQVTAVAQPRIKFYSYGKAVRRSLQMFLDIWSTATLAGSTCQATVLRYVSCYGMRFTWWVGELRSYAVSSCFSVTTVLAV